MKNLKWKMLLFLFVLPYFGYAQQAVTGIVTEKDGGAPIPGVNITVKGTTSGTITDLDGAYSINVEQGETLVFSFIGYATKEMAVSGSVLNVDLETDAVNLDELVVIGYGAVKKSDITGSVASVKAEDFNKGTITSADQLIQGKAAGVTIMSTTGEPGAAPRIRVRGGTSLSAGNSPLYVIDGVPVGTTEGSNVGIEGQNNQSRDFNPLAGINPNDIESMEILKDASSTAIYGSRGANGVILITTKSGKGSKPTFTYNGTMGISQTAKRYDLMSADEYRAFYQSKTGNVLNTGATNENDRLDFGADTDWQDEIFRTAYSRDHHFAFGAGNENSNYRVSLGYTNQDGIIRNTSMEKINAGIKVNQKLNDYFKVGVNLGASRQLFSDAYNPSGGVSSGGRSATVMSGILRYNPTWPVYNADGTYFTRPESGDELFNPVSLLESNTDNTKKSSFGINPFFYMNITKDLVFRTNLSYNAYSNHRNTHWSKKGELGNFGSGNGVAGKASGTGFSQLMENDLTYSKDFGKHSLTALAGYSYQKWQNEGHSLMRTGIVYYAVEDNNFNGTQEFSTPGAYKNENELQSFYGRLNYSFNGKYLFTATLRRDGSSRFGENNKYGTFPSFAFGWRASEEIFLKDVDFLSNLKVRLGYGVVGNQEIGNYNSLDLYRIDGEGIVLRNQPNKDLKWETTTTTNAGIDFGFLDNRLSGSVEVYMKSTTDLFVNQPLAQPAPAERGIYNLGEISNKGFEFNASAVVIKSDDFDLTLSGNIATNKNEIISLSNGQVSYDDGLLYGVVGGPGQGARPMIMKKGLPVHTFWGIEFAGFDAEGVQTYYMEDGSITTDQNEAELRDLGSALPTMNYSFSLQASYKNFDASIFFRGASGFKVFNNTAMEAGTIGRLVDARNVLQVAADSPEPYDGFVNTYSSRFIEDGNFLKLDNISLGYNFNTSNILNGVVQNIRIYASGQNLLTITDYSGLDPEVSAKPGYQAGGIQPEGVDYNGYPVARIFSFGIQVNL